MSFVAAAKTELPADPLLADLKEYASNATSTLRVDREKHVVYGVKILGFESQNTATVTKAGKLLQGNRKYNRAAIAKALPLYEGRAVYFDHAETGEHPYGTKNGHIENVRIENDGLYANHHYNPFCSLTEAYLHDAEHSPKDVGFSQHADGRVRQNGADVEVYEICKVHSVDLVGDPASVGGLFESVVPPSVDSRIQTIVDDLKTELSKVLPATVKESHVMAIEYKDLTIASLRENCPDLVAVLEKTDAASKLQEQITKLTAENTAGVAALKEALAANTALQAEKAEAEKLVAITAQLKEAKIDVSNKVVCSDLFMATLKEAKDEAARKAIIDDRVSLCGIAAKGRATTGAAPFGMVGLTESLVALKPGASNAEVLACLR